MNERSRAPALLLPALLLALGYHALVQLRWMLDDNGDASGVCCDAVGYVVDAARWTSGAERWFEARSGALWSAQNWAGVREFFRSAFNQLAWSPQMGWMQLLAAFVMRATASEEFGYLIVSGSVALTQVALVGIGWQLQRPMAGVLAAALYPMMPVVAWCERRLDVYTGTALFATVGALAVLRSRSLSRKGPAFAFAVIASLAACMSPRPTDNTLLLMALASIAGLAWLRGLILARDQFGEPVGRARAAILGVVIAVAVGAVAAWVLDIQVSHNLSFVQYLSQQAGDAQYSAVYSARDPRALVAYGRHIVELGWTRWNAVGLGLGVLLWLVRGRARAELLGWTLVPLLVLSLLPKKNPYYAYMILPGLSLLTALGVAELPWRALRWAAGAALLLVAGAQHLARSFPDAVAGTPLATTRWVIDASAHEDRAFQSPNWEFLLAPRPEPASAAFGRQIVQALPRSTCDCPFAIVAGGNVQWGEYTVPVALGDSCARLTFWPIPPDADDMGVLLIGEQRGMLNTDERNRLYAVRELAKSGFTLHTRQETAQATLEIWLRDEAWFSRFCANRSTLR